MWPSQEQNQHISHGLTSHLITTQNNMFQLFCPSTWAAVHSTQKQHIRSVKCANSSFHMELQDLLDQWNSRLSSLLCSLHCMWFAGSCWFGDWICPPNKSMCPYVLCYPTERIASPSQCETQIHQLTLVSPKPIWTYKTCLIPTSRSNMPVSLVI